MRIIIGVKIVILARIYNHASTNSKFIFRLRFFIVGRFRGTHEKLHFSDLFSLI